MLSSNLANVRIRKDCPLSFLITDSKEGWANVKCRLYDFEFTAYVATIWYTSMPTGLLEAAYFFLDYLNTNEGEKFNIKVVYLDKEFIDDEGKSWTDVPKRVRFVWDEEPSKYVWNIEINLQDINKNNARLNFTIEEVGDEKILNKEFLDEEISDKNPSYKFKDVLLSDFAYAVAKCFTECLKKYGINGYHLNTWDDDISIRQLLVVKAFALGLLSKSNEAYNLNFEDELQLLLMDM